MALPSALHDDWTVEKLHALPDDGNRYEIIDGVLYVTHAPRFVHQAVLRELSEVLRPFARGVGLDVLCLAADIQYSDRTLVQPDLFVYPRAPGKSIRDWRDVQPLQLVVEVLSRSTQRRDRTVKRDLYQRQNIPEYWIVDADTRTVEWWRPDSTNVELSTDVLCWHPQPMHEPLCIDLAAFFRQVLDE